MTITFVVKETRTGWTVVGVFDGVETPSGIEAPTAAQAAEVFIKQLSV